MSQDSVWPYTLNWVCSCTETPQPTPLHLLTPNAPSPSYNPSSLPNKHSSGQKHTWIRSCHSVYHSVMYTLSESGSYFSLFFGYSFPRLKLTGLSLIASWGSCFLPTRIGTFSLVLCGSISLFIGSFTRFWRCWWGFGCFLRLFATSTALPCGAIQKVFIRFGSFR